MKFRDPKTGKVFEDIFDARERFCEGKDCNSCVMPNVCRENLPDDSCTCRDFAMKHPAEAARLMGFGVVEEEQLRDTTKLPRICQVLGVEKAMEIVAAELRGDKSPGSWYCSWQSNLACTIMDNTGIDHDTANKIAVRFLDRLCESKPRFTEEEVADARAIVRILGADGIERTAYGGDLRAVVGEVARVVINRDLFPSLRPGQSVALADIVGVAST